MTSSSSVNATSLFLLLRLVFDFGSTLLCVTPERHWVPRGSAHLGSMLADPHMSLNQNGHGPVEGRHGRESERTHAILNSDLVRCWITQPLYCTSLQCPLVRPALTLASLLPLRLSRRRTKRSFERCSQPFPRSLSQSYQPASQDLSHQILLACPKGTMFNK